MDVSSDYIVIVIYLLGSSVPRDALHARYAIAVWSIRPSITIVVCVKMAKHIIRPSHRFSFSYNVRWQIHKRGIIFSLVRKKFVISIKM